MRKFAAAILVLGLSAQAQSTKVAVTFTKDVAPIMFHNCSSCHRAGEVAPFALLTYADAKKRAKQMVQFTESRQMPPWKPETGHGDFVGERRMKPEDIAVLKQWVDQGCVEGDAKDLPATPKFPEGWAHGEPDLIVKMPEAYTVPAEGRDVYRAFVVPLNLTEDKYVRAVQYRPSNTRVVHHALLFLDILGESRKKEAANKGQGPGFRGQGLGIGAVSGGSLGGWAPGGLSQPFPDGMGKEVKKNADLILQLHFSPSGKPEKEQSQVGLWFTKERPQRMVAMMPLSDWRLDLTAGAKDIKITDSVTLPVDVDLIGIIPHAHYLGKECKVWAKTPDGKEIPLIWIKDWDFDWQEQYRYKEIVRIPKGSELNMIWIYDNSATNPKNPSNPPKRVRFGEQTEDEMAMAFLQVATLNRGDDLKLYLALAMKGGRPKK
jgi:hypothetical protein